MKIKVSINGSEKYVKDIKNSTPSEPVKLELDDTKGTEWTYRGLAMLGKKFPDIVFMVE